MLEYALLPEKGVIPLYNAALLQGDLDVDLLLLPGADYGEADAEYGIGRITVGDFDSFFSAVLDRLEATEEQRAEIMTRITMEMAE